MYQNKADDVIVTPAHILFAPLATTSILNFSDIGVNTLLETSAFAKIRNFTKAYNTHLTYTPSSILYKYSTLQSLYFNENNFMQAPLFSLKPQHMFLPSSARNSYPEIANLDSSAFQKFLQSGVDEQNFEVSKPSLTGSLASINSKLYDRSVNTQMLLVTNQLLNVNVSRFSMFLKSLLYPSLSSQVNNDSDKFKLQNPLLKWNSNPPSSISYSQVGTPFAATQIQHITSYSVDNLDKFGVSDTLLAQQFNINGPNSKVLLGDQSVRSSLPELPQSSNLNLSLSMNTARENLRFLSTNNRPFNVFIGSLLNINNYVNYHVFNDLLGSQSFNVNFQPPIHSLSTQSLNSLEHDTTNLYYSYPCYTNSTGVVITNQKRSGLSSDLFIGSREKTPRALNTSY
jgi:hypothetical protein